MYQWLPLQIQLHVRAIPLAERRVDRVRAVFFEAGGYVALFRFRIVLENAETDPRCRQVVPYIINGEADELAAVTLAAHVGIDHDKAEPYQRVVVLIRIFYEEVRDGFAAVIDACERDEAPCLQRGCVMLVDAAGEEREETEVAGGPLVELGLAAYPFRDDGRIFFSICA